MCCWAIYHDELLFSAYFCVRYSIRAWKQVLQKGSGGKSNQFWNVKERSEKKIMSKSNAKINSYYQCEIGFMIKNIGLGQHPSHKDQYMQNTEAKKSMVHMTTLSVRAFFSFSFSFFFSFFPFLFLRVSYNWSNFKQKVEYLNRDIG